MSKIKYRDLKSEMEPDVFELEEKRMAKESQLEPLQDFESLFIENENIIELNSLKDKIDYRFELLM